MKSPIIFINTISFVLSLTKWALALFGSETEIFRDVNSDLAPKVARPSVAMRLTLPNKTLIVFRQDDFKLQVPFSVDQKKLEIHHYSNVILSTMAPQITGVSIVCSTYVPAQINENIKVPRHWHLCGEFAQKASNTKDDTIWWRHHDIMFTKMYWAGNN